MVNPLNDLIASLTSDAKGALAGLVAQTHANIAANPTPQTVAAQYALLTLSAPALLPNLQTDVIKQVNDAIFTAINSVLIPSPSPVPAPELAPVPEPVPTPAA